MYCAKCGALNAESSSFCYSCGNELKNSGVPHELEDDVSALDVKPPPYVPSSESADCVKGDRGNTSDSVAKPEVHLGKKGLPLAIRLMLALLACAGIYIAYVVVGVLLGWKRGGGLIPIAILVAIMGCAWKSIMGIGEKGDA